LSGFKTGLRLFDLSILLAVIFVLAGCSSDQNDKKAPSSKVSEEAGVTSGVNQIVCSAFGVLPVSEKIYAYNLYQAFAICNNAHGFDLNDTAQLAKFTDLLDIALQFATVESRASITDLYDALHDSTSSAWMHYQQRRTNATRQPIELYGWVDEESGVKRLNGVICVADPSGSMNGERPYQLLFSTSAPHNIPQIPYLQFTNLLADGKGSDEKTVWKYSELSAVRNGMGGIEDVRIASR